MVGSWWPGALGLTVVLGALAWIHVGFWGTAVSLGDEGDYVRHAASSYADGTLVRSLYLNAYKLLFATVTTDPLRAHLLLRLLTSALAAVGLWMVLRRFQGVSPYAAALTTCLWIASYANVPHIQLGLQPLFCLALVLPALALALGRQTLNRQGLLLLALLGAASSRPEYLAPTVLLALYFTGWQWRAWRLARHAWRAQLNGGTAVVLALALVLGVILVRGRGEEGRSNPDAYLLVGLVQGYAVWYLPQHPDEHFNPYSEAGRVTDRVFDHPRTFTEAVRHNPGAFATYVAANATQNLRRLPAMLLLPRVLPGFRFTLENRFRQATCVLVLAGGGLLLWLLRQPGLRPPLGAMLRRVGRSPRAAILVLLTSASAVPLLIHITEARLVLTVVPLLYLLVAWGLDQWLTLLRDCWLGLRRCWPAAPAPRPPNHTDAGSALGVDGAASASQLQADAAATTSDAWLAVDAPALLLVVALAAWWCWPLFPGGPTNQPLILAVREYARQAGRPVTLAGAPAMQVGAYALGTGYAHEDHQSDELLARIRAGGYDLVIISSVALTSGFGNEHREFYAAFLQAPGACGYVELLRIRCDGELFWLFGRPLPDHAPGGRSAPPKPAPVAPGTTAPGG